MGASTNPNAVRHAALQVRRQTIEDSLAKRNEELRQLCVQEAELTGSMPAEIPLETGESPPVYRRCIGTSYQLSENLINLLYNDDESINSLEISMQVQANLAEAALGLANESNTGKTLRRQRMAEYQHHKRQYNILEEKLSFLKAHTQMAQHNNISVTQQPKQKKKPRPVTQGDSISLNVNLQQHEPFEQLTLRHSMRSLQLPLTSDINDYRDVGNFQNQTYRNSDTSLMRPEDALVSGIYRLSINGYKTYMERKENTHIIPNGHMQSHYITSQHNPNFYQQQLSYLQMSSQTLPHSSHRSQQSRQSYVVYNQNFNTQSVHEYAKCSLPSSPKNAMKLSSSPGSNSQTSIYSKSPSVSSGFMKHCRQYPYMEQFRTSNPHQIQPHQRYEHDMMTAGLGGYWKRIESGELVWCNSIPSESWQCDKRFGSLDRRRNKLHKRASPLVDPKSATISVMVPYPELVRPPHSKAQQIPNRNHQEMRQLVRTQSLGSVGAQTIDSIWPSDDNSSCGSDAQSINESNSTARRHKQKEWFETSLDGPSRSIASRSYSTVSSTASVVSPLSPEEKYIESPLPHKQMLEIPAQSKPNMSPSVQEPNMELFNNNIPKNGTLIQAGHCKPYHEETKPFEMSDFYKYSTKFKKSAVQESSNLESPPPTYKQHSLSSNENPISIQKGVYQPLQSLKCQPLSSNSTLENMGNPDVMTSPHLSQTSTNIAENFSAEMNAWYQNQGDDNNNPRESSSNSRSAATLV